MNHFYGKERARERRGREEGGEGNSDKWQKFVIGTQYLAINLVVNVGWYFPAEKH